MKTAMQELIDYVNNRPLTQTGEKSFAQVIPYGEVVNLAKELIEKEKEQILNAFVAGDERGTKEIPFNCEQYYSQTFKSI